MNIQQQLLTDLKDALRAGDTMRKETIRMALAALKNKRVEKNADLTDQEMLAVLQKEVKQRKDSIIEYQKGNRQDLVEKEAAEIEILQQYLPAMMERGEVEALARQAIAEVNATSPKHMGQVMSKLMPRVKGLAEGRMVSAVVRELLAKGN